MVTFDPTDAAFRADPYRTYARLRREAPVHRAEYAWYVSRHADVLTVLRDPRFASDFGRASGYEPMPTTEILRTLLLFRDGDDHTRLRTLVNRAFTPRAVEALRVRVERIVGSLLDGVDREFDLIANFASPLPAIVICELLGVPAEDREKVRSWSRVGARVLDVADEIPMDDAMMSAAEMLPYFGSLIDERRKAPGPDILSALIAAEEQGNRLHQGELVGTAILLLLAGHETTQNLIGNGTLALLRNPSQWALLRDDPSLVRGAVEELLRYDSPVQLVARTATEDAVLTDQTIRAGEPLIMLLGAANRDEDVFPHADRLDVTRRDVHHVAFGGGGHFCVGASLARLEAQIALRELVTRMPSASLVTEREQYHDTLALRGLRELRIAR